MSSAMRLLSALYDTLLLRRVTMTALLLALQSGACAETNSTVVFRVVVTTPSWGQEKNYNGSAGTMPAWENASPVKDATGYSLYDVEIACNTEAADVRGTAVYSALYKFSGWSSSMFADTSAQWTAYWSASTLSNVPMSSSSATSNSGQVSAALQSFVDIVAKRERPTRIVVDFSGHGNPFIFFQDALTTADAVAFLQHIRSTFSGIPLILDLSTNCNDGYFDFVVNYYALADYLISSDKEVGGFDPTLPGGVTAWLANQKDNNINTFWQSSNSLTDAFSAYTSAIQAVWYNGRDGLASSQVEQSLTIYKLSEFYNLMRALSGSPFNPLKDLPTNSYDIATYIKSTNSSLLVSALTNFQIAYVSDRNLVRWTDNALGFSASQLDQLTSYVRSIEPLTIISATAGQSGSFSPQSIVSAYGGNLSVGTASAGLSPSTILSGTTVGVKDSSGVSRPAVLFYVSPGQVNFEIPDGTALGPATVSIQSATGSPVSSSIQIANVSPGLFELNASKLVAAWILPVVSGVQQGLQPVYQLDASGNITPLPLDLAPATEQVYLMLYGTGIRNAKSVTVTVGGLNVPVLFAGAAPVYAGLDQVNIGPLPSMLTGRGSVNIILTADGEIANTVNMTIK